MTLEDFRRTLAAAAPPSVPPLLVALWYDGKGDWSRAHTIAQDVDDEAGAWVHAYLHRKEGDLGNARYWYRRASRPESTAPLDEEWAELVDALL